MKRIKKIFVSKRFLALALASLLAIGTVQSGLLAADNNYIDVPQVTDINMSAFDVPYYGYFADEAEYNTSETYLPEVDDEEIIEYPAYGEEPIIDLPERDYVFSEPVPAPELGVSIFASSGFLTQESVEAGLVLDNNSGNMVYVVRNGEHTTLNAAVNGRPIVGQDNNGNWRTFNILIQNGGTLVLEDGAHFTGRIRVENGGHLIMNGGIITGSRQSGVFVANGGTFDMFGGEISGNESHNSGGGVFIQAGGNAVFNMHDGLITNNRAFINREGAVPTSGGGAGVSIENNAAGISGTFNMFGGTISNNAAQGGGGGVRAGTNGTFNMYGGLITGNSAGRPGHLQGDNGGGVRVLQGNTFTMTGGEISGNRAYSSGGGVFVHGSHNEPNLQDGRFYMLGGSISDNYTRLNGGGIFTSGVTTILMGTITQNTATNYGGGIALGNGLDHEQAANPGALILHNGFITHNTSRAGAGVSVNLDSSFTMNGGTIANNTATESAGGLRINGTAVMHNGTIASNTAGTHGGGISILNGRTFTMHSGTITENQAGTLAGAVILLGNSEFIFNSGMIARNRTLQATADGGVQANGSGSHFIMNGGTLTNNFFSDGGFGGVTVHGNAQATLNDGAIDGRVNINNDGLFTMNGGTITRTSNIDIGSGVFLNGGSTFDMFGGTIRDITTASEGAGVSIDRASNAQATFNMYDGLITNNRTVGFYSGGGVSLSRAQNAQLPQGTLGGTFNMMGGEISHNSALHGSGVRVGYFGTFNMMGGEISHNITHNDSGGTGIQSAGSGVYVHPDAVFNFASGRIAHNEAQNGGGIHVQTSGRLNMSGGLIYGNFAFYSGGGMNVSSAPTGHVNLNITGGVIDNNSAGNNGGGIKLVGTAHAVIENATIANNTAQNRGGGISANAGSTAHISSSSIANNTATSTSGGAIATNGSLTIRDAVIEGNNAAHFGGGIITLNAASNVEIFDGLFNDNHAHGGGAIYVFGGATVIAHDATFTNNTSIGSGGAVFVDGPASHFTMHDGEFADNHALDVNGLGGAIHPSSFWNQVVLPQGRYNQLNISETVEFIGNTAGRGLYAPPSNYYIVTNVNFASTSAHHHVINNYDISFYAARGVWIVDVDGDDDDVTNENVTVTPPPGGGYDVITDDDGNIIIILVPRPGDVVNEDDVISNINIPDDWTYEAREGDDGTWVIIITPPRVEPPVVIPTPDPTFPDPPVQQPDDEEEDDFPPVIIDPPTEPAPTEPAPNPAEPDAPVPDANTPDTDIDADVTPDLSTPDASEPDTDADSDFDFDFDLDADTGTNETQPAPPINNDPTVPPVSENVSSQMILSDDGEFWIELDEMGVPLGTWTWDNEEEMWLFDPDVPLGFFAPTDAPLSVASLPQTGVANNTFLVVTALGISTVIAVASAGLIVRQTVKRRNQQ